MTTAGSDPVFLLTDYGDADEFAGVLRAVIVRHAPQARIVDLTHGVPPFDVRAGALALSRCVRNLGPGVVVAVVDPGVGSERRAVAVRVREDPGPAAGPLHLVGPDNGLLGFALDALGGADAAVALPGTGSTGGTFDGRDLFAPVAARLCSGAALNDVGVPIDPAGLVRLTEPTVIVSPGGPGEAPGWVEAEVVWVDRFGNVQLAAGAADAARAGFSGTLEIRIGATARRAVSVASFAALGPDEVGVIVDANGRLALVCHLRPAATVLGVRPGDVVTVTQIRGRRPASGTSVADGGVGRAP